MAQLEAAQKLNLGQISDMEEEFLKLASIEDTLKSEQGKLAKTVDKFAVSAATYTQVAKTEELLKEINDIIERIAQTGRVRGKVMSTKTMNRYLEQADRAQRAQRTIDMIDRANRARHLERLEMYQEEVLKEMGILRSDISLFRRRAKLAGLSSKETIKRLVRVGADKSGAVQGFKKRLQSLETAVLRREASSAEIDEYKKQAKPGEQWQWITVSVKPCPDCVIRAGVVLPLGAWEEKGIPGSGNTVCGSFCMCKLIPISISEELFPTAKTFQWSKTDGVLTTAGDKRTFGAKSHQPPQKKDNK